MNNINNYGFNNQFTSLDRVGKNSSKVQKADSTVSVIDPSTLSEKSQSTLDKLKEKYSNMDFFVVDSVDDENAKKILDNGTNEYTVVMTKEELEKMASDEDYLSKRMSDLDDFMEMSEKLKNQYNKENEDGEGSEDGSKITKFGATLNSDGTTTYFVELEKMSAKQKERLEEQKEKKAEEKKANEAKENQEAYEEKLKKPIKTEKTEIKADSIEELLKKVGDYFQNERMNSVRTKEEMMIGRNIDFSL